jgi:hypothetical protein
VTEYESKVASEKAVFDSLMLELTNVDLDIADLNNKLLAND